MRKIIDDLKLQFDVIKEGKTYVAYCPALDLSTCGKSIANAKASFSEAVDLFFETIIENNSLEETLSNLGWQIKGHKLMPPIVVTHSIHFLVLPTL